MGYIDIIIYIIRYHDIIIIQSLRTIRCPLLIIIINMDVPVNVPGMFQFKSSL